MLDEELLLELSLMLVLDQLELLWLLLELVDWLLEDDCSRLDQLELDGLELELEDVLELSLDVDCELLEVD